MKLHRSPVLVDYVHRSQLLEQLQKGRKQPLALVTAPAGYGKSTLVSCSLETCGSPGAWLSLDEHDNDLRLILFYFLAAVQTISRGAGRESLALVNAWTPPVLAGSLANELDRIEQDFILVLDDFQLIGDKSIHDLLDELLRHPPRPMHLVLVGCRDQFLPNLFQYDLLLRPYFEKGLGIWDKIQWHYLGSINPKDALLNNRIDAKSSLFGGSLELAPDGTYVCKKLVPENPTAELLDSGRKVYMVGWEPEIIKKSYDFDKDMALRPILIRKGACKGIDRHMWGIGNVAKVIGSVSMPDNMVQEMIRVRQAYREELAKYHPMLELLPESPYPFGTPKEYVHPGVEKAMKKLGLPIPAK